MQEEAASENGQVHDNCERDLCGVATTMEAGCDDCCTSSCSPDHRAPSSLAYPCLHGAQREERPKGAHRLCCILTEEPWRHIWRTHSPYLRPYLLVLAAGQQWQLSHWTRCPVHHATILKALGLLVVSGLGLDDLEFWPIGAPRPTLSQLATVDHIHGIGLSGRGAKNSGQ